jgi:DNA-binding response OmpR family regulator
MGHVLRVLLIEPPPLLARALRRGLEEEGFVVSIAADGTAGDCPALAAACDVILLGPLPPRAEGGRFVRRWQNEGLRTPVLVLTAGGSGTAEECLSVPFPLEELLCRVRALARRPEVSQPA